MFVVHVVPPAKDDRTNYYGNLLGLCGWHYSLVRYGEWVFVNPETGERFADVEDLRGFVAGASCETDEAGNEYFRIKIRFWNVYQGWNEKPAP